MFVVIMRITKEVKVVSKWKPNLQLDSIPVYCHVVSIVQ